LSKVSKSNVGQHLLFLNFFLSIKSIFQMSITDSFDVSELMMLNGEWGQSQIKRKFIWEYVTSLLQYGIMIIEK